MSLSQTLSAMKDKFNKMLKPEVNSVLEGHIELLRRNGAVDRALKAGAKAPSFTLPNQDGQQISSSELLKRGPLVVSFTRGGWCPYCAEEVKALNAAYDEYEKAGVSLVVISPQSAERTKKQAEENQLKFDLLIDKDNQVGKQFGVVYGYTEDLKSVYLNVFKNDIAAANDSDVWELPMPARFILRADGTIQDAVVNPDYRTRPEPTESLQILQHERVPA